MVVIMPRQAGKDELLANLVIYLMRLFSDEDRSIVVVNPTYDPRPSGRSCAWKTAWMPTGSRASVGRNTVTFFA